MHMSCFVIYIFAAGRLLGASAHPVDAYEVRHVSSLPTDMLTPYVSLASRQEWELASAPISRTSLVNDPLQSSVLTLATSNVNPGLPAAITTPPAQGVYMPKRENFGSRSILVVFAVIGVVVLIIAVWAIIAHRSGRRPFACFDSCGGRNKGAEATRSDSMGSDIPFVGAGRHYDRRPVSMQPQPSPLPTLQRPKPVRCGFPRQPVEEPEWARGF